MAEKSEITEKDVIEAQDIWGQGIVEIGHAYTTGGDVVQRATEHIKTLYGYDDGPVLFKPTKCEHRQFRSTFEGALSYFVGDNLAPAGFEEDKGFAIAPFVSVEFRRAGIITDGGRAIAMGNYFFTPAGGAPIVKVEYTFGYKLRGSDLVIDVHHSSVPYVHKTVQTMIA